MRGRKEHLNKELPGTVKKYLALTERPVDKIVALKCDDVTFLVEWHHTEIV